MTFFVWQNAKHNVRQAPPEIFDQWIRQYVEEIIDVNTQIWDKFDRWGIINEILKGGFLILFDEQNGTFSLRSKQEMEEESSEMEDTKVAGKHGQ